MDILADNNYQLSRFKSTLPNPEYICGFLDGDATIYIRKLKNGYQTGISISQSRTNILRIMAYHFGGNIYCSKKSNTTTTRNEFIYRISPPDIERFMKHIYNKCVIKHRQLELLNEFCHYRYDTELNDKKEELYSECYDLNNKSPTRIYKLENLTIAYISGLFDAEGCIYVCKTKPSKFYVSITQKTHPEVLLHIKEKIGYGSITDDGSKLRIYNKPHILAFFELIENNCIVKYNQIQYMKKYLTTHKKEEMNELIELLSNEKHLSESDNIGEVDISSYREYINEKIKIETQAKEKEHKEKLKEQYIQKSIKMKTEQNHIYSAPKSEITKKRIGISNSILKRTITDEQILQVRALLDTHKNIEIEKMLGLARHQVSRIRNGQFCLTTELDTHTKTEKKTKEEVAIMKRKISLDEILILFNMILENKPYSEMLEKVEKATIDICKNMKSKMRKGDLPFYACEFDEETYQQYKERVDEWRK